MEEESKIIVLGFYKYVKLENVEKLKMEMKEMCDKLGMRGSILLAEEGVNASVSGTKESMEKFKSYLLVFQCFALKEELWRKD